MCSTYEITITENDIEVVTDIDIMPVFEKSLFMPVWETSIDYLEIGMDAILKDGVLKEIPLVGTAIGIGKLIYNIADRNFIKQTLCFIDGFRRGTIEPEKLASYREKINLNPKKREKELARIINTVNRNKDAYKSAVQGRFFCAYVSEIISWEEFCELCDITERLFMSDITTLQEAYMSSGVTRQMETTYKHDRLVSIGLLYECGDFISLDDPGPVYDYKLTTIGKMYGEIAFESGYPL